MFGSLILNLIKDAFSGAVLVLSPAIYLLSYLFSTAIIFAISTLMLFVASWQIKKLDIMEGLKVQDE